MSYLKFWKQLFLTTFLFLCCSGYTSANDRNTNSYPDKTTTVTAQQQGITVTCTVSDALGPVIGANIMVRGTSIGSITDMDGRAILENIPGNAILVISYIGYVTREIPVNNQQTIAITLIEDTRALEEVVVVGYSTQQRKDITGSVAVVETSELLKSTGSSASQQLQGKAPGVYIGSSGAPGSPTMVRIRGVNTVNDNGPLYVIDGVSTRDQDLSSINPHDIESMQVLKDASSAAIYGAQAANGVILITTKKGLNTGQPTLTYDGYFGVQQTTKRYDVLNSMDRLNLEWAAKKNAYAILGTSDKPSHVQFGTGDQPTIPNYLTVAGAGGRQDINPADYSYPGNMMVPFSDTNWWDEVNQTGTIQNHQATLSGGNDKGQYTMSANYFDQKGTVVYTYFKRYQVRANTSYNIRPWLRAGENLTYMWRKDLGRNAETGEATSYSWTYRASPWVPLRDIQGNYAGSKIAGTGNWQNPVASRNREQDNYWSNTRIFGNLWAEADLYKGLTFRTSFGLDYHNNYHYRMEKKNLEFSESPGQNNLEERGGFTFRWVWTNTLTYNATFNNIHRLTALVGTEAIRDGMGRQVTARRYNYLYENNTATWVLNMGENNDQRRAESEYRGEMALFGIFGRVDYAYKDKYLLTGIIRRDGVSRFSQANRYAVFPSASMGWRMSEETFMEPVRGWLDDLKLRAGYGETGNAEIPRASNWAYEYTTDPGRTNYDFTGTNTSGHSGFRLERYGNEDTRWETVKTYNVGLDATIQGGKFGIGVEWYRKKTSDMLIESAYSDLAGEADAPYVNYGDMTNVGWDIVLNYRDSRGDWGWDVSLNLSTYKNEVTKLSEADDYSLWRHGARLGDPINRTTKGQPIAMFYGYKLDGFYESAQEVLDRQPLGRNYTTLADAEKFVGKFKFADTNNDGVLNTADRTYIGNPHPDLIAGLNLGLTYKNFDLTAFFYSTIGNDIFNNTKYFTDFWLFEGNKSSRMRDLSWQKGADNRNAILPVFDYQDGYSGNYVSSYYVEDGSFVRLKNLVIGYTFPKELLRKATISNLRVYLQSENLFTISGYSGLDPEATNSNVGAGNESDLTRGLDMGGWPTLRSFTVGVNFVF